MSQAEKATQTINFLFSSVRCGKGGLRWAEGPDEVPEWDASWDYPLTEGLETVDKFGNLIKGPPERGYPRLVRKDIDTPAREFQHDGKDIVNKLSMLYKSVAAWREGKPCVVLRNEVLNLAEEYGAPYGDKDNTLEAWLALAARVQIFLWAYRYLDMYGAEALLGQVHHRLDEDKPKAYKNIRYSFNRSAKLSKQRKWSIGPQHIDVTKEDTNINVAEDWIWDEEISALGLLTQEQFTGSRIEENLNESGSWDPKYFTDTHNYRLNIAEFLYPRIGTEEIQDDYKARIILMPDNMIVFSPLCVWVDFKLAEIWRHGAEVRACPVCGSIFVPNRSNAKYCKSRGSCSVIYNKHGTRSS